MIIHTISFTWYTPDLNDTGWKVYCLSASIVRWSVPSFVMISGVLFLGRDIPIKKLYSKYIFRLLVSYALWSAFYAFFEQGTFFERFHYFLSGPFHMWFVLMMTGLYICTPLINKITADENNTLYFLILSFFFGFLVPTASLLVKDFGGGILNRTLTPVFNNINKMNVYPVLGYTGYFILGYYLNRHKPAGKQKIVICILSMIGLLGTIYLTWAASHKENRLVENYFDNLTLNLLLSSAGIFVFFQYRNYPHIRLNSLMAKLSKYSYGAYVIHMFVLLRLKDLGYPALFPDPVLKITCTGITLFIISYLISALLNHIPYLNKYIV